MNQIKFTFTAVVGVPQLHTGNGEVQYHAGHQQPSELVDFKN